MSPQKQKKTLTNWDLVSVNPSEKNWDWKDLFCYWGVNVQSVIGFSLISMLVFSAAIVFSDCARSNPGSTGIHDYLNELDTYAALPFLYSMFDVNDKKGIEQTVEKDDKKSPSLT